MSAVHLSERRFVPHVAVDLGHTLAVLQRGRNDPTLRISSAPTQTRVALTARISEHEGEGVAALLEQTADTTPRHRAPIRVIAWGHLAAEVEAFVSSVGRLLGFDDDWSELLDSPSYSQLPHAVRYARETHPGLRLSATRWVFKQGVSAIFEQRVTGSEAIGAWQRLTKHHGTPPPPPPRAGLPFPSDLRVFPTPRTWLDIPSWQWRQAGVDAHRRDAVRALADAAPALARLEATSPIGAVARALANLPGIGPWTVAETLQRSHGLPDAISIGDYHLAHAVCYCLEGRRGDDARMLELLAPWSGHRQRVVRLIGVSGVNEPRRGPRVAPRSLAG
ncbi:DNA-3-methyladenine glycosylase [uncultured Kocuria sp.]|uniref:DNA-3-methyladenine glycosylase family protein n=1 Tax=uncultured Kocuria sp. TaxID=259305 RepID=UPI0025939B65|nr:hypothetical protein [uncultured Kocuria sp.]MCT1368352.1 hypothetical protein [Rothia sp. p3-SID1597]